MVYHEIDKKDIYLKRAMWECYNKKCLYCGIVLEPRQIQIDHILPTDESKLTCCWDPDLKQYVEELKKQGFSKNSIENYALSCVDCNVNKKRNYSFSASNFRFYHEYTSRYVDKIIKKMNCIKREWDEFVEKENLEHQKESRLNYLKINYEELSTKMTVTESQYQAYFKFGLGNVRIDAFLPVTYDDEISCLVSFKELYDKDVFLTYDEEDIIKYLFSGYNTPYDSGKRKWCFIYEDIKSKSNNYEIILPNFKIEVSGESLSELSKIADALYEAYILQNGKILSIIGAEDFKFVDKGNVKLLRLNTKLWSSLWSFMKKHQYDQENNEMNVFHINSSEDYFFIHNNINSQIKADILAKISIYKINDEFVELIWSPGYYGANTDKMADFDNIKKWTANYTHDWIIKKLIPYVCYEDYCSRLTFINKVFGHRITKEEFDKNIMKSGLVQSYKE